MTSIGGERERMPKCQRGLWLFGLVPGATTLIAACCAAAYDERWMDVASSPSA
jgi:hypothetical protein